MAVLTQKASKRLGKRAAAYVEEHAIGAKLRDSGEVPPGVARTLTRVYGTPQPGGYMSEESYWTIDDENDIDP